MQKPMIDETKLPEVKQIICEADSIMSKLYCNENEDLRKELEQLQIKEYWHYDEAVSLDTAARGALMCPPQKEDLTDEQIKDIVVHILDHDEAKMDWWLLYLEVNTGLPDLSDYIFYPNLIGLDGDPSMEEIAEKIIEDRRQGVKIFL